MNQTTLLKIAARGAIDKSVVFSSSQLASDLGLSQQTAARRLKVLENEGLITREMLPRGQTIRITQKGKEVLGSIYLELSTVFGKEQSSHAICGSVGSGIGEGKYYMEMEGYRTQFKEKLGFNPFPGTLNLKLKSEGDIKVRQELVNFPGITIEGFKNEGRTFGEVKCFKADIEGIKGAVIMPSRTHHTANTLELIAIEKIRERFGLKDGDKVCVKLRIG